MKNFVLHVRLKYKEERQNRMENYIKIINDNIQIDQLINNLSVAGKLKVLQYRYKGCNTNRTVCYLQNPENNKTYKLNEKDFEFLENHWDSYKAELISRHELRDMNHSTTYIICLMHYLEVNHLLKMNDYEIKQNFKSHS